MNSVPVQFYEISATDSIGNKYREILPSSVFAHKYDDLAPTGVYDIEVRAISQSGKAGEAASQLFSLTGSTHDHHKQSIHIHKPTVSESRHHLIVKFTVEGKQDLVKAFQVEEQFRSDNSWQKVEGLIPVDPTRLHYEHKFNRKHLSNGAEIRIAAIGTSGNIMSHSEARQVELQCQGLSFL